MVLISILAASVAFAPRHPFRPAQVWEKPIAPGLIYRMEFDPNLPRITNAIRLSPGSSLLRWTPELAGGTINEDGTVKGRLTPTEMARQLGAIAVVNGDFFSYEQGAPVGQMVRSGELITTPIKARTIFAWGPTETFVGTASAAAFAKLGANAEVKLQAVNQPLDANSAVLYTPAEGIARLPKENLTVVAAFPAGSFSPSTTAVGTVEALIPDSKNLAIADGKACLVATGSQALSFAGAKIGDKLTVRLQTPGPDWAKVENAVGGGPFLLKNGVISVDGEDEGFNEAFLARNPRTAIGKTPGGDVWIVTVDGRQAGSVGATLEELAKLMLRLGCTDAMNLDGGGSTALNLRGMTVGRPSDGVERPVSNAICLFGPKPAPPAGKLSINQGRPNRDKSIPLSVSQGELRVTNTDVLWACHGAAWVDQGGLLHPIHSGRAKVKANVKGVVIESVISVTLNPALEPKKITPADRD